MPSPTLRPPIQLASSGFSLSACAFTRSATLAVSVRVRVAEDVNGVRMTPMRRKKCAESLLRFRRQLREFAHAVEQRIRRKNAGTAGVRENRQTRSPRARLLSKNVGHMKQLGYIRNPQNARTAEGCFVDLIASSHGAGVRRGGTRSGF